MYIDTCKTKKYTRHLLRENYREDGNVKHHTIANLSHCSENEIEAIKLALKHKGDLSKLCLLSENLELEQGLSTGAVLLVHEIAKRLGIVSALGNTRDGKLALWQVIARVINQGSRLSAVRLASKCICCDILNLDSFNENNLYSNLKWLEEKQHIIENRLYRKRTAERNSNIYLYDVTSSYLEGDKNELAMFGYNRDGKKSKKQIVIGLLCDDKGYPLGVEVFKGNTQDPKTFARQLEKVADRFNAEHVTFVGDRGMIKSDQIKDLGSKNFNYITAITKVQIETLIKSDILQMELFDEDISEVITNSGIRYILRRNPIREKEIKEVRDSKLDSLKDLIEKQNAYLREHPKAYLKTALKKVAAKAEKLKISNWIDISGSRKKIRIEVLDEKLKKISDLDGCYAIKTDLPVKTADSFTVHKRYKDLAYVESAFRCSKTAELELRPIFVRREASTKGHVFVVMLAYIIARELAKLWHDVDGTVQECLDELKTVCCIDVIINGVIKCAKIPKPRADIKLLIEKANVIFPKVIPRKNVKVATRRKLTRKSKHI
ncbi:MAG: IS1634 family transposase [Desulfobacterales bacterium]|nr:IS1634 family transposase [Desulfobacterales bacterium]